MADTKSVYVIAAVLLVLAAAVAFVLMQKPVMQVPLNKQFDLREGETMKIEGAIEVKFIRIVSDSRCPAGVKCVWAGEAVAEIEAKNGSESYGLYNLSSLYPEKGAVSVKGFTIRMLKVEPQKEQGEKPLDYVVTFVVTKENVSDFESCAAAGYPIMESYPRQCRASDGRLFVEQVAPLCMENSDCATGFCKEGVCSTFQPSFSCSADSDCILINQENKLGCCWAGYCDAIDYSKEEWIAVNKQWFSSERELYCPPEEECGPSPECPTVVVNSSYEAKCIEGVCEKAQVLPYDVEASIGNEFSLRIGEAALIKGHGIYIKVGDVAADSRCPEGVQCVWAGEAVVIVEAYKGSVLLGVFNLSTLDQTKRAGGFGSYSVELVKVEPAKQAGKNIAKEDYIIKLSVSRA
ncbi:MAG: hypothetical protein QW035_01300 [Candidatus Anstonellales archaeon]